MQCRVRFLSLSVPRPPGFGWIPHSRRLNLALEVGVYVCDGQIVIHEREVKVSGGGHTILILLMIDSYQ